jgi:Matrixin
MPRRTLTSLAIAGSCALGVTVLPGSARAFCREVTVPTPAGYDPAVMGCFYPRTNPKTGGGVFDLYWNNFCVGYSIAGRASKQVSLADATRLAARAFAAWSGATCPNGSSPSIAAFNEGPVQCDTVQYNPTARNQHVIIFRDDGWPYQDSANVLGLTTLTVNTATGEIYDADMEINSHDFSLSVGGVDGQSDADPGGFDLLGILTHEAGHFLGLAHSENKNAIMYALYTPGQGPLSPDDVAGVCAIDPPDGTHSTSASAVAVSQTTCDPMPMNGFAVDCAGLVGADAGATPAMCLPADTSCSAAAPRRPGGIAAPLALVALAGLGGLVRRRRRALKVRTS